VREERAALGNARRGTLHIGKDGFITVMTEKLRRPGARAELTQSAAENCASVRAGPADHGRYRPGSDDGMTAGSRTTRQPCPPCATGAAALAVLIQVAAQRWAVEAASVEARDGKVLHAPSKREVTYADWSAVRSGEDIPAGARDVTVTPVKEWKVMEYRCLGPTVGILSPELTTIRPTWCVRDAVWEVLRPPRMVRIDGR